MHCLFLLRSCSACESICGMQSMLLLSWRCAERNLPLQSSLGALWEFWGFTGGSWRRGPGQVRGHWLFHPSLTLGWQLERRNLLRHQNSWQLGFHRMPWRHKSPDRGSCSLYGPEGEAAVCSVWLRATCCMITHRIDRSLQSHSCFLNRNDIWRANIDFFYFYWLISRVSFRVSKAIVDCILDS